MKNSRDMEEETPRFFEAMPFFNKMALGFFVLTKLCGLVGFAMGFGSGMIRTLGGCVLGSAFFFLICTAACCFLQSSQENKKFAEEDSVVDNIRKLKQQQLLLEEQVKELEDQRVLLEKLRNRA
jgi:uncharacterized membrane protein YdjX (TVP38/TMEM64 family)